jgi:hypothetical protein
VKNQIKESNAREDSQSAKKTMQKFSMPIDNNIGVSEHQTKTFTERGK